jgi:outer membrane protein OmpA-like peptidoglycan-associated protein
MSVKEAPMIMTKQHKSYVFCSIALSAGLLLASPGLAHDQGEICNALMDGNSNAVLLGSGSKVIHAGSGPCPVPDPVSSTIYFDHDKDYPNAKGEAALAELIDSLDTATPVSVDVDGHADRSGTEEYNVGLSERRAAYVAGALIDGGALPEVVTEEAFGESDPAVPTADGVREEKNRRAEVEIKF